MKPMLMYIKNGRITPLNRVIASFLYSLLNLGGGKMDFGEAIKALKEGKKVARKGWNGKGMFLYLINGREFQNALKYGYGEYECEPTITSSIAMKTAQNTIVVGWLASQTDMLAEDWEIV